MKFKIDKLYPTCRICGRVFEASRKHARYCSPKCRQAISRLMRARAQEVAIKKGKTS